MQMSIVDLLSLLYISTEPGLKIELLDASLADPPLASAGALLFI